MTIVCEGHTERDYFKRINTEYGQEYGFRLSLDPRNQPAGGFKPGPAVARAIAARKRILGADKDRVWVVFDCDDVNRAGDPSGFRRLSDRLERLLSELDTVWRELAAELGDLVGEVLGDDSQIIALDLDPFTEGPIFTELERRLAVELDKSDRPTREFLSDVARRLAVLIESRVSPPHFPGNLHLQDNLRKELRQQVSTDLGVGRGVARPIAEALLGLAVSERERFLKE